MKFLVFVLSLLALFTLSVGVSGGMSYGPAASDWDSKIINSSFLDSTNITDHRNLKQATDRSECGVCQSANCNESELSAKGRDQSYLSSIECQSPDRFILPLDIFLLPLEKEDPSKKSKPFPILSKRFLSFFIEFIDV